jgi:hypothetical protein
MGLRVTTVNSFVQQHQAKIAGVVSCLDRVVITGSLPEISHREAMARYLGAKGIRLFDYKMWAQPLGAAIQANAEALAAENGLQAEFIRRLRSFRKEDRIKEILAFWGTQRSATRTSTTSCAWENT